MRESQIRGIIFKGTALPMLENGVTQCFKKFKIIRSWSTRQEFMCFNKRCKWLSHLEIDHFFGIDNQVQKQ